MVAGRGSRAIAKSWLKFRSFGQTFEIAVDQPLDSIQREIAGQRDFYEIAELSFVRCFLPTAGARVLDVGANIGNHAIFFDRVCQAEVVVFEPNPPVAQELVANLRRNRCWRTDTRHLGVALGASSASGHLHLSERDLDQNNRGGTCVQIGEGGTVPVQRLDTLVTGNTDLIKIDVEGMALEVLAGAAELLQAEPRPMLFVEVEGQNEERLWHWLDTNNYVVRATFSMYADIVNYFCLPIGWRPTSRSMTSSGLRLMARYCALRLRSAGR